ncbi:hypothetical protein Golomagni_03419 [Golovinomyces magnicellulatus]|nr:hypothetical protein Golomagni_03419 [Golovinomyces magnicellulatus]
MTSPVNWREKKGKRKESLILVEYKKERETRSHRYRAKTKKLVLNAQSVKVGVNALKGNIVCRY